MDLLATQRRVHRHNHVDRNQHMTLTIENTQKQHIYLAQELHRTTSSLPATPTPSLTSTHSSHIPHETGTGYHNTTQKQEHNTDNLNKHPGLIGNGLRSLSIFLDVRFISRLYLEQRIILLFLMLRGTHTNKKVDTVFQSILLVYHVSQFLASQITFFDL